MRVLDATLPACEDRRLAALHALDILDTPPEERFDIFTRIAAGVFGMPISLISLIDADRQWFKSAHGLDLRETPRGLAFGNEGLVEGEDVLLVPDTTRDERFQDNPMVTGEPGIRFFAGAPIRDVSGLSLGTLCVMDRVPRLPGRAALGMLKDLATGVSSAMQLNAALRRMGTMAATDPLTGLANRHTLEQTLKLAIGALGSRSDAAVGLLLIDLDRFKEINELFGHAGGDAALREVGRRIRSVLRDADLAARLGEDEFAVVIRDLSSPAQALAIAGRLHGALAAPCMIDGMPVALRCSIGVALAPFDAIEPAGLLRIADAALYRAKRTGRGRTLRLAGAHLLGRDTAKGLPGRQDIEAALRASLTGDAPKPFVLAWQPIFHSNDGTLMAAEALVRWPRPRRAPLVPDDFIPVAEATGLITHLDRWVLRTACAAAASWDSDLPISINMSAANFYLTDLLPIVMSALAESGLSPDRLEIEVTETVLLQDPDGVRQQIDRLRGLGLRIALDDFGGGHGTLGYLNAFPFDTVKIDRAFIRQLDSGERAEAVVRAIIQLGQALSIRTVAEGVETQAQLDFLTAAGATAVQGFLLGAPMPEARLTALFAPPLG
ncbi:EAL domain-containing protein [Humitalea rosea]|uniref:EAL domain-containing protein n=1 Tax=Humitalea rosea TaxID=990373 RepID=UPI000DAD2BC0